MIIKYDGKRYEGTPREIVEKMNKDTVYTNKDIREYMLHYSRREFIWDGRGLRINPRDFLYDLEDKGLLEIIEIKADNN